MDWGRTRVARREDENEDAAVEEAGEDLDAGDLHGGDEGGGGGRVGLGGGSNGVEEGRRVVGDKHADEATKLLANVPLQLEGILQDAQAVEDEDAVEGEPNSPGNSLARILRLSDRNSHQLGTKVRKGGIDHGRPYCKELAPVSSRNIRLEGSGVAVEFESSDLLVGSTAADKHQTQNEDTTDGKNLDA